MKNYILSFIILTSLNCSTQEQKKDTLYIKYDKSYLIRKKKLGDDVNYIYRIKGTGNNGFVYFLEKEKTKRLKGKKIKCLKKIFKESKIFYKKDELDDWKVSQYLGKYIVFLAKENEFVKVQTWYEIE